MSATAAIETAPWSGLLAEALTRRDPIARGRTILDAFLADPARATALPLERRAGGYARNFLFGDGAMGVWAMTWAPEAATSIHDHHCSCCFAVLSGSLTERWFDAVGADRARLTRETLRGPGFSACLLPSGPNIHQIVNASGEEAISLHVYGFDPATRTSSVEREYRLAAL